MRSLASQHLLGTLVCLLTLASSAPRVQAQTVLIYDENSTNMRAIDAATRLGLTFTRARASDFVTLLTGSSWDLVVVDLPSTEPSGAWQTALVAHIRGGGRAIHTHWSSSSLSGLPAAFEVTTGSSHDAIALHRWSSDPLFTTPQVVPDHLTMLTDLWGTNGFRLEPAGGARAAAGFTMTPTASQAAIVIGNSGRTIFNGFLFDDYGSADTDTDGIPDITELVMNEISLLAAIFPTAPCMGLAEGAACTAMPGGAGVCRGGVCCYGCWTGTRCERGTTGTACGVGGAMCASCVDGMACTLDECTDGRCGNPTAPAGTACDDGMYCTATDTCDAAGMCTGAGNPCDDGESCTMDVCDEATDSCSFPPTPGSCTIGGECVGEGAIHPGYPCLTCDPARRTDDWSPLPEGTECGMPSCSAGRLRASACDAAGTCLAETPVPCPTGTCLDATSCEPPCTAGGCPAGEYCDATAMRCMPLLPDGTACVDGISCTSGMCVDGVCCTSACDGVCERCDEMDAAGECRPVAAGMDPDMECATACDGAGACEELPDAGAPDAGMPEDDAGMPGDDAGGASDGGGGLFDAGRPPPRGRSEGCSCGAAGADSIPTGVLAALAVLATLLPWRRRRRRG